MIVTVAIRNVVAVVVVDVVVDGVVVVAVVVVGGMIVHVVALDLQVTAWPVVCACVVDCTCLNVLQAGPCLKQLVFNT